MTWYMFRRERVIVVEYINKYVCKGRNRKQRIKRIRVERLITVVRRIPMSEVGSYPPEVEPYNVQKEKK